MKFAAMAFSFIFIASTAQAQSPQQEFTDPIALLKAVAKTYAAAADTFHFESIEETTRSHELHHEWSKVYRTAIKGPANLYRIETRSHWGSYVQDSDGTNEWVYLAEAKVYVKRPLPQDWPGLPRSFGGGSAELKNAWSMRIWLDATAGGYRRATMLPAETIAVDGRNYPCYVVHVTSDDLLRTQKDFHSDTTFWIDKSALAFRKQVEHDDSYSMITSDIRFPSHWDVTTIYPVVDIDPQTTPEMFRFTPPADAKEVASLEPSFPGMPPQNHPKAQMVGQMAPDVSFAGPDGKMVALASYRGKPLILDIWATWCGSCLLSMPALNRTYALVKGKGMALISIDQDNTAEAAMDYLARHHYGWVNYHDESKEINKAFKSEGIPLTVLIDAQGKIVYYDFGGDESALREAIAGLGPEFATVARSGTALVDAKAPSAQK